MRNSSFWELALARAAIFGLRMTPAVEIILSTAAELGRGGVVLDEELVCICITVLALNLHTLANYKKLHNRSGELATNNLSLRKSTSF